VLKVEKFDQNEQTEAYVEPVIEDYGSLQELTAAGGSSFHDVPAGAPVTGPHGHFAGSTP
jgi:hypothetical protein